MGGNLGYDVLFVLDATYTFDRSGPDGILHRADDIAAMTGSNLPGEFATMVDTAYVLKMLASGVQSLPSDRPPSTTSSAPVT